jgi:hypothetical protein
VPGDNVIPVHDGARSSGGPAAGGPEDRLRRGAKPLTATRALLLLDELRVPCAVAEREGGARAWQELSGSHGARALHWYAGDDGVAGGYTLSGMPLWGHVVPEAIAAERAAALDGDWRPDLPVIGADGQRHASVWRTPDGGTLLPFDPDELLTNFRSERYREMLRSSGSASLRSLARRCYYAVRPLMPRPLQIAMRRSFARVQARADFPRWPVEPVLHDLSAFVLSSAADAAGEALPYLAPWPCGHDWALVLTHDVETAAGRDAIERVRAIEERMGYRSSWNLVPERYTVDDALVAHLHDVGNEVGVHGLRHDGRDLESLRTLRQRLPEIRRWADRWGAVGFRSPATHRRWEWMPMLGFDYDASYPDTDPYEPMPGGCCSWLPFFNEGLVELPITLTQDHTLLVILQQDDRLWREKAEILRRRGGMALLIVHPDYMLDDEPLRTYERFLEAYRDDGTAWKALPREVSDWWRRRAATSVERIDGKWRASGPAAAEAGIRFIAPHRCADAGESSTESRRMSR